jgi:hypothetical protein
MGVSSNYLPKEFILIQLFCDNYLYNDLISLRSEANKVPTVFFIFFCGVTA